VITSGTNPRQVRTIAEHVEAVVKQAAGVAPRSVEGLDDATWVLLDYGTFVVHVFLDETRAFYALDRLWADAPHVDWEQPPAAASRERSDECERSERTAPAGARAAPDRRDGERKTQSTHGRIGIPRATRPSLSSRTPTLRSRRGE
jgi:hypothetical protein